MLLTQTAEYALRAMTVIAHHGTDESLSAPEISRLAGVPASYLSKLLRKLVVGELLEAKRGRGGGFRLAQAPSDITFYAILDAVDAAPVGNHCAFGWGACNAHAPCPLHDAYHEVTQVFCRWAKERTLDRIDLDLLDQAVKR